MATLTLKFKENILKEFEIEQGKSLTIGRRNDNTVMIENLAVSGFHAKVDIVGDGFLLSDLQSKNGTFVNDQKISTHWLKNGDIITIGKHTLVFTGENQGEEDADDAQEEPSSDDMIQTMVMDTEKQRALLSKSPPKAPAKPTQAPAGKHASSPASSPKQAKTPEPEHEGPMAVLSYLGGGDGEVLISKKIIKIGKNPSSDIISKGLLVGQTAATISKRPNGYYLSYVEGMAKVKVNNETIKEAVLLKEFDVVEVGSVKLQFTFKED
ncbi:MAG: FHA domain-containing protein [Desulfobacterales bacterium]|nr:FHA domain-containing protein [Desulfobacterales bacterium]MBF0395692.1 FHA domain-containing protein [Desulfobacterales bacterium]